MLLECPKLVEFTISVFTFEIEGYLGFVAFTALFLFGLVPNR